LRGWIPGPRLAALVQRIQRHAALWALRRAGVLPIQVPTDSGRSALPVRGTVDWPKQGASVPRGIVMIRGWAASRHEAARRVVVTVDGQVQASARVGRPRVDVSAHLRDPLLLDSGFDAAVDLSDWPRDRAQITVAAQGGDDREFAVIADFALRLQGTARCPSRGWLGCRRSGPS